MEGVFDECENVTESTDGQFMSIARAFGDYTMIIMISGVKLTVKIARPWISNSFVWYHCASKNAIVSSNAPSVIDP